MLNFFEQFFLVCFMLLVLLKGQKAQAESGGLFGSWGKSKIGLDRSQGRDPFEGFYGKEISGKELDRYFALLNKHILSFPKHSKDQLDSKDELLQFIEDKKITSIAELTEKLPGANKMVLMVGFQSKSLHESSCAFPRIIASSVGGLLVCSWNGDPSQANYETLEC